MKISTMFETTTYSRRVYRVLRGKPPTHRILRKGIGIRDKFQNIGRFDKRICKEGPSFANERFQEKYLKGVSKSMSQLDL